MKKSPARNMLLKKAPSKLLERINSSIDVDVRLFQEDIEASRVHCKMLIKTKIISLKDGKKIINGLQQILRDVKKDKIKLDSKFEDIHMNVEALLHSKIGPIAGKLHTGRSRNDQVVTDFKLWIKKHSRIVDDEIKKFIISLPIRKIHGVGKITEEKLVKLNFTKIHLDGLKFNILSDGFPHGVVNDFQFGFSNPSIS